MSDFKVVLPTTTEEWQRDMDIAYQKGRAEQKEEDNAFFNFEGAWELEKKKVRADAIDELEPLFKLIVEFENAYICDEMCNTEYCEENCKYDCPQKECYLRYLDWLKEQK